MIKTVIYLKTPQGPKTYDMYHLPPEERARLDNDLASFYEDAEPMTGVYKGITGWPGQESARPAQVTVIFAEVAMIGG